MSVAYSVTPRGVAVVRRALNNLSHFDARDLLDNVGAVVEAQTRRRIQDQEGPPEGGDWEPWAESYADWKARKGKARYGFLRLYGDLLDSMTHNVLGSDAVEVGSNRIYAAAMQLGSRDGDTPPREYLGLSDDNEDELEEAVVTWFTEVLGR